MKLKAISGMIALLFIVSGLMLFIHPTEQVSAVTTYTWDGGGANALASTKENWVGDVTSPTTGDSLIFDAGSIVCTYDLVVTINTLTITAGYSGTITLGADITTTGAIIASGGTIAFGAYYMNVGGDLGSSGAYVDCSARFSGNDKIKGAGTDSTFYLTPFTGPYDLTVNANKVVHIHPSSGTYLDIEHAITINSGATLDITTVNGRLRANLYFGGTFTNSGTFGAGASGSTLDFDFHDEDKTQTFGAINANVAIVHLQFASANRIMTVGANAVFGGNLTVYSIHASQTMTLDTGSKTVSCKGLTIGALGKIVQTGGGAITATGFSQVASGVFNQGGDVTINVNMDVSTGTFTGSTTTHVTCSGNLSGIILGEPNIVMSGNNNILKVWSGQTTYNLTFTQNTTVFTTTPGTLTIAPGFIRPSWLQVSANKKVNITTGVSIRVLIGGGGQAGFTNYGNITGKGNLGLTFYDGDITGILGTIEIPTNITKYTDGNSRTLTLGGNALIRSSLIVNSTHVSNTMTLDLSTNNYSLSANNITIASKGIIRGRGGIITDSGHWDSFNGSFVADTSKIVMVGSDRHIRIANGQSIYNLTIDAINVSALMPSGGYMRLGSQLDIEADSSLSLQNDSYVTDHVRIDAPSTQRFLDPNGKTILCIGDSLTGGANEDGSWGALPPQTYWPYYLQQLIGVNATVVNRGRGGHQAIDILPHLAQDMADVDPDIVIVMLNIDRPILPINWVNDGKNRELSIINALLAYPNIKIIWSTLIPWGQQPFWNTAEACRSYLDDWIRSYPLGTNRIYVADMDRAVCDPLKPTQLRPEYIRGWNATGFDVPIHMSKLGASAYARSIYYQLFTNEPVVSIDQNGHSLNITGTNANPIAPYGPFDGNIYLNGTASSLTIFKMPTMTEGMIWTNQNVTYIMPSISEQLAIAPTSWFGFEISDWDRDLMRFIGNGTSNVTFILSGIDSGKRYKVSVDGGLQFNLVASSGGISFTYPGPWSEHQFEIVTGVYSESIVKLGVIIGLMMALGILVSVLVPVVQVAQEKRKFKVDDVIQMVIYIVVSVSLISLVYALLP